MVNPDGLTIGAATRAIEVEPGLTGAGLRMWSETFTSQESPLEIRALVATSVERMVVAACGQLLAEIA